MKKYRCPLCGCKEWYEYGESVGFLPLIGWETALAEIAKAKSNPIPKSPPTKDMGGIFFDVKACKACRYVALVGIRFADPEPTTGNA